MARLNKTGGENVTETAYEKLAAEILEAFDAAAARIPGWNEDLNVSTRGSQRVASREIIQHAIDASERVPALQQMETAYTQEGRDMQQFVDGFFPVLTAIKAIARHLELMFRTRETKAGRGALRIYETLRRLLPDNMDEPSVALYHGKLRDEYQRFRPRRKRKRSSEPAAPEE